MDGFTIEEKVKAYDKDEKIRQELIAMVKLSCTNGNDADEKIAWLEKQGTDISSFSNEQQKYMGKYLSLDKITLIKLLAERDRNVEETTKTFEKQGEQWGPSDDQLDALHDAAVCVDKSMFPYPKGILMKLYKQLKKLKEE